MLSFAASVTLTTSHAKVLAFSSSPVLAGAIAVSLPAVPTRCFRSREIKLTTYMVAATENCLILY